jgi:D-alanine-D-alanine ligase
VFVKPCALGSSVGITKAKGAKELQEALNIAIKYDHKIIVEQAIEAREIECSILGNQDPKASLLGEIIPSSEFYDYRAKYISQSSKLIIPADLRSELTSEIRNLAVAAFKTIDCTGMARVDFLVRRRDEKVFLNEINTIPGFTEISMYPKLWEATGIPFKELIDRLIQLAIERHSEAQRLFGLGNQIGSKNLGNCKE